MKYKCKCGYDYQETCQRYNITGCKGGKFAEFDFKEIGDCKYLIKEIKNE